jgi:hypothetical protein
VAIERWVLVSAIALTAVAGLMWRTPLAMGSAAAGGLLASLNLLALRRLVGGIIAGGTRNGVKALLAFLLFLKMGLLLVAIWATVRFLGFSPVGVGFGASALIVGVIGGSLYSPQGRSVKRANIGP